MRRLRVRLLHKSRIIEIPSPSMSIVVDQTMNDIQEKWIRSPRKMKSLVVMTICVLPLFFHICSCQYPLSPPLPRVLLLKVNPSPRVFVLKKSWMLFFFFFNRAHPPSIELLAEQFLLFPISFFSFVARIIFFFPINVSFQQESL